MDRSFACPHTVGNWDIMVIEEVKTITHTKALTAD
jgi:hypothetical protein